MATPKSEQDSLPTLQPAAKGGKPTTDPRLPPTNGNVIGPDQGTEAC